MRINKLIHNETVYINYLEIIKVLSIDSNNWILDCEMDDAVIEIKDNVLYWKSGILYWGYWKWGVFDGGEFRSGIWNGGIYRGGEINKNVDIRKIVNKK